MDQYYFSNEITAIIDAYQAFLQKDSFVLRGKIIDLNLLLSTEISPRFADIDIQPLQRAVTVYSNLINLFTIYADYLEAPAAGTFEDWSDEVYPDYGVRPAVRVDKIYSNLEGSLGFASEKSGTVWSIYFGPSPIPGADPIKTIMKIVASTSILPIPTLTCSPTEFNFKFDKIRIRELTEGPDQIIPAGNGNINIGKPVVLEYQVRRCCTKTQQPEYDGDFVKLKGSTPDNQSLVRINSELLIDAQQCPTDPTVLGKITYKRYFNVRTIAETLYNSLDITVDDKFLLLQVLLGKTNIYNTNQNICSKDLPASTPKVFSEIFKEFGKSGVAPLKWGSVSNAPQYTNWTENGVIDIGKQVTSNSAVIILERFLIDAGFSPNDLILSTTATVPSTQALDTFNSVKGKTLLIEAQEQRTGDGCGNGSTGQPPPKDLTTVAKACFVPYIKIGTENKFQWSLALEDTPIFQDIYDFRNDYDDNTKLFRDLEFAFPTSLADNAAVIIRNRGRFIFEDNINIQKTSMNKVERKSISSNPCYTATAETFRLDIKRKRKRYIKVQCGAAETIGTGGSLGDNVYYFAENAISNPDFAPPPNGSTEIDDYLFTYKFGSVDTNGVDSGEITRGKLATYLAVQKYGKNNVFKEDSGPNVGQLYIFEEGYYPLYSSDRTRDFVSEISDINTIEFTKNNLGCVPDEYCVDKGWTPDPTDLCGCVEVSVHECYDVYPALEYLDGNRIKRTIPERLILKIFPFNPDYPFLTKGQRVVSTRRASSAICNPSIAKLYHPLLYGGDILPGVSKNQVYGIFNGSSSLDCYYTSSTQTTASKQIYYDVLGCNTCDVTPFYAVAYGHYEGSGSMGYNYDYSDSSAKAIYSQFRLLGMEATQSRFMFLDSGSANTPKDVYVINYYRNGLSHKLDLGNFEINLAELNGTAYPNIYYTGSNVQVSSSNKVLSLIDNSGDGDDNRFCTEDPTDYYDIVSGSLTNGIHSTSTGSNVTTYGKIFPNIGVIVLDGGKLNSYLNFNSVSGSNVVGDNSWKIHTAISGAAILNKPMIGRTVKQKTTNHYFIRIPVDEANYSTNPTYLTEDTTKVGHLKYDCFIDNPITYITTVGLYNDTNELLAIAKLNKPIQKSYENDILIKIRLNW
jgi:hypothetical protein